MDENYRTSLTMASTGGKQSICTSMNVRIVCIDKDLLYLNLAAYASVHGWRSIAEKSGNTVLVPAWLALVVVDVEKKPS